MNRPLKHLVEDIFNPLYVEKSSFTHYAQKESQGALQFPKTFSNTNSAKLFSRLEKLFSKSQCFVYQMHYSKNT